jgi:beta-glucosidase-like glycosyl hydrolase
MTAHTGVTSLQSELSLRDKLAQLMFVRIGSNLPPIRTVEEDEDRILKLLEACPIGGLLLFNGGPNTKESLKQLQQAAKVPLLVAADMERGVGQQVRGFTIFPHAMAFDRLIAGAAPAVAEFAWWTAQEALDVGIHISFSPVADVSTNPKNPIIATRAFSTDADRAAEMAAAYVVAAEAPGLRSCAKHFPGHGDTHQDSHDSLPSVTRSLNELKSRELVPFSASILAGCSLVMTAHVAFPAIDPSGLPATLSQPVLEGVLRQKLGFEGVICSDSLLMAGVRDRFASEGEMVRAAIVAGVDLLLDIKDPIAVIEFLCNSIESGSLHEARVDQAFERVWALKQRVVAELAERSTFAPEPPGESREPTAAALAERVARTSIEIKPSLTRGHSVFVADQPLAAILLKTFELPSDPPEQPLADALRATFRDVRYMQLGPRAGVAEFAAAEQLARERPHVLVAMIVKPAAWHAFGLLPPQREFVERLTRGREVVLACLGVPYALDDYPDAKVRICTYSDVPVSQRALAEFLVR